MTNIQIDPLIIEVKNNYSYLYEYIDVYKGKETEGIIYDVNGVQFFVDNKETYIKHMI